MDDLFFIIVCQIYVSLVQRKPPFAEVAVAQVIPMTFEEIISCATHIVTAKYTGEMSISRNGHYKYLKFQPISSIKGEITDDYIYVSCFAGFFQIETEEREIVSSYSGDEYAEGYRTGEEYLLVLEKHISVFYDFDRYVPVGSLFVPKILTKDATMYGRGLSEQTGIKTEESSAFRYYVEELIPELLNNDSSEKSDHVGPDFVRSSNTEDIISQSEYIFNVTVLKKNGDYSNNNSGYDCRIDEQIKGRTSDEIIDVHTFPDALTEGEQYLVCLSLVGPEGSILYAVSSRNSVYPASDTAIRDQVDRILSQEN